MKIIINEIPLLRRKMAGRNIEVDDSNIVFLLARSDYKKQIKILFPNSKLVHWIDFRISTEK